MANYDPHNSRPEFGLLSGFCQRDSIDGCVYNSGNYPFINIKVFKTRVISGSVISPIKRIFVE